MNYEEAATKARMENFLAYSLAGIGLIPIILLDSKSSNKGGYRNFLIKCSYLIIPGSILSVLSIGEAVSLSQQLFIWFGGTVFIYLFISLLFAVYVFFNKFVFRRTKKVIKQSPNYSNSHLKRRQLKQRRLANNNNIVSSKWKWFGFIVLFVIITISAFFFLSNDGVDFVRTDKNPEFSEIVENLYRNTKYNFRIKFPEGWEIKPGDGPNILQKAVKGNHSISIAIKELPTGFNNEKLTIKDVFTLKEFENKLFDESFLQKYPKTKIIDSGETKINNLPAFWYKTSFSSSALGITVDMIGLRYVVLYKNVFYFISAGTTAEEFAFIEPEFKKSIITFVLENH